MYPTLCTWESIHGGGYITHSAPRPSANVVEEIERTKTAKAVAKAKALAKPRPKKRKAPPAAIANISPKSSRGAVTPRAGGDDSPFSVRDLSTISPFVVSFNRSPPRRSPLRSPQIDYAENSEEVTFYGTPALPPRPADGGVTPTAAPRDEYFWTLSAIAAAISPQHFSRARTSEPAVEKPECDAEAMPSARRKSMTKDAAVGTRRSAMKSRKKAPESPPAIPPTGRSHKKAPESPPAIPPVGRSHKKAPESPPAIPPVGRSHKKAPESPPAIPPVGRSHKKLSKVPPVATPCTTRSKRSQTGSGGTRTRKGSQSNDPPGDRSPPPDVDVNRRDSQPREEFYWSLAQIAAVLSPESFPSKADGAPKSDLKEPEDATHRSKRLRASPGSARAKKCSRTNDTPVEGSSVKGGAPPSEAYHWSLSEIAAVLSPETFAHKTKADPLHGPKIEASQLHDAEVKGNGPGGSPASTLETAPLAASSAIGGRSAPVRSNSDIASISHAEHTYELSLAESPSVRDGNYTVETPHTCQLSLAESPSVRDGNDPVETPRTAHTYELSLTESPCVGESLRTPTTVHSCELSFTESASVRESSQISLTPLTESVQESLWTPHTCELSLTETPHTVIDRSVGAPIAPSPSPSNANTCIYIYDTEPRASLHGGLSLAGGPSVLEEAVPDALPRMQNIYGLSKADFRALQEDFDEVSTPPSAATLLDTPPTENAHGFSLVGSPSVRECSDDDDSSTAENTCTTVKHDFDADCSAAVPSATASQPTGDTKVAQSSPSRPPPATCLAVVEHHDTPQSPCQLEFENAAQSSDATSPTVGSLLAIENAAQSSSAISPPIRSLPAIENVEQTSDATSPTVGSLLAIENAAQSSDATSPPARSLLAIENAAQSSGAISPPTRSLHVAQSSDATSPKPTEETSTSRISPSGISPVSVPRAISQLFSAMSSMATSRSRPATPPPDTCPPATDAFAEAGSAPNDGTPANVFATPPPANRASLSTGTSIWPTPPTNPPRRISPMPRQLPPTPVENPSPVNRWGTHPLSVSTMEAVIAAAQSLPAGSYPPHTPPSAARNRALNLASVCTTPVSSVLVIDLCDTTPEPMEEPRTPTLLPDRAPDVASGPPVADNSAARTPTASEGPHATSASSEDNAAKSPVASRGPAPALSHVGEVLSSLKSFFYKSPNPLPALSTDTGNIATEPTRAVTIGSPAVEIQPAQEDSPVANNGPELPPATVSPRDPSPPDSNIMDPPAPVDDVVQCPDSAIRCESQSPLISDDREPDPATIRPNLEPNAAVASSSSLQRSPVASHRGMQWLKIPQYFLGRSASPEVPSVEANCDPAQNPSMETSPMAYVADSCETTPETSPRAVEDYREVPRAVYRADDSWIRTMLSPLVARPTMPDRSEAPPASSPRSVVADHSPPCVTSPRSVGDSPSFPAVPAEDTSDPNPNPNPNPAMTMGDSCAVRIPPAASSCEPVAADSAATPSPHNASIGTINPRSNADGASVAQGHLSSPTPDNSKTSPLSILPSSSPRSVAASGAASPDPYPVVRDSATQEMDDSNRPPSLRRSLPIEGDMAVASYRSPPGITALLDISPLSNAGDPPVAQGRRGLWTPPGSSKAAWVISSWSHLAESPQLVEPNPATAMGDAARIPAASSRESAATGVVRSTPHKSSDRGPYPSISPFSTDGDSAVAPNRASFAMPGGISPLATGPCAVVENVSPPEGDPCRLRSPRSSADYPPPVADDSAATNPSIRGEARSEHAANSGASVLPDVGASTPTDGDGPYPATRPSPIEGEGAAARSPLGPESRTCPRSAIRSSSGSRPATHDDPNAATVGRDSSDAVSSPPACGTISPPSIVDDSPVVQEVRSARLPKSHKSLLTISPLSIAESSASRQHPPATNQRGVPSAASSALSPAVVVANDDEFASTPVTHDGERTPATRPHGEGPRDAVDGQSATSSCIPSVLDSRATARSSIASSASDGPSIRSYSSRRYSVAASSTSGTSQWGSSPELKLHMEEVLNSLKSFFYKSASPPVTEASSTAGEPTFTTNVGSPATDIQPAQEDSLVATTGSEISHATGAPRDLNVPSPSDSASDTPDSATRCESTRSPPTSRDIEGSSQRQSPPASAQYSATRMTTPSETPPTSKAAEPAAVTSPLFEGSATPQRPPTVEDSRPRLGISPPTVAERTPTTPSPLGADNRSASAIRPIATDGDSAAVRGFQSPLVSQSSSPPATSPWSSVDNGSLPQNSPATGQRGTPHAISPWSVGSARPPVPSFASDRGRTPTTSPPGTVSPATPSPPTAVGARSSTGDGYPSGSPSSRRYSAAASSTSGTSQWGSSPELRLHMEEVLNSLKSFFYKSASPPVTEASSTAGEPASATNVGSDIQPAQDDSLAVNNESATQEISSVIGSPSASPNASAADSPPGPTNEDSATVANDAVAAYPGRTSQCDSADPTVSPVRKSPWQTSPQFVGDSPRPQSPLMAAQPIASQAVVTCQIPPTPVAGAPAAAISPHVGYGGATPEYTPTTGDSRPQLTTSPPAVVERAAMTPTPYKTDMPAIGPIAVEGDGAAIQGSPPPATSPCSSVDGSLQQNPPATGQRGTSYVISPRPDSSATKPHVEDQTEEQPSAANDQPPAASAYDCSATARSPTIGDAIEGSLATSLLEENSVAKSPTPCTNQDGSSPELRSHADEIQSPPRSSFYESVSPLVARPTEASSIAALPTFATDIGSPVTKIQSAQEDSPIANSESEISYVTGSPRDPSPSDSAPGAPDSTTRGESTLSPPTLRGIESSPQRQSPPASAQYSATRMTTPSETPPTSKAAEPAAVTSPLFEGSDVSQRPPTTGDSPQLTTSPPASAQYSATRATTPSETPPTPEAEPAAVTSPVLEGSDVSQRPPTTGDSPQLTTSSPAVVERRAMTPSPYKSDMSAIGPIATAGDSAAMQSSPPPGTSPWSSVDCSPLQSPSTGGQRGTPYATTPWSESSAPPPAVPSVTNDSARTPAKPHVGNQTEDQSAGANDRPPEPDSSAMVRSLTVDNASEGPSATIPHSETPTPRASQGSSTQELRSHADEIQRSPRAPFYKSTGSLLESPTESLLDPPTEADFGSPATEIQPAQEDSPVANNESAAQGISPITSAPSASPSMSAPDSPPGPANMDSATVASDAVAQPPDSATRGESARMPPVSPLSKSPLHTSPQSVVNSPQPQSPPMSSQRRATTPSEASPASKVGALAAATSPVIEGKATPQRTHATGDSPQLTMSPPAVVVGAATTPSSHKTDMSAIEPIAVEVAGVAIHGFQTPLISQSSTPPPAISPWSSVDGFVPQSPPATGQHGSPCALSPSSRSSAPPPTVPTTKPHIGNYDAAPGGQPEADSNAAARSPTVGDAIEDTPARSVLARENSAAKSPTPRANQDCSSPELRSRVGEMQSSAGSLLVPNDGSLQAPSTDAGSTAVEPTFATDIGFPTGMQPIQEKSPVANESAAQGISAATSSSSASPSPDSATRGEPSRSPHMSHGSKSPLPSSPPQTPLMAVQHGTMTATTPSGTPPTPGAEPTAATSPVVEGNATPQRTTTVGDSPQLAMSPPAVVVRTAMTPSPHKTDMSAIAVEGAQTPLMSQSSTPPPVISPWSSVDGFVPQSPFATGQRGTSYAISPCSSSAPPPAVPPMMNDGECTSAKPLVGDQTEYQPEAANDRAPAPDSSVTARSSTVGDASEGPPATSALSEENNAAKSPVPGASQGRSSPGPRSHTDDIQNSPRPSLYESTGPLLAPPAGSLLAQSMDASNIAIEPTFATDIGSSAMEIQPTQENSPVASESAAQGISPISCAPSDFLSSSAADSPLGPASMDSATAPNDVVAQRPGSATRGEASRSPHMSRGSKSPLPSSPQPVRNSPLPQSPPMSAQRVAPQAATTSEIPLTPRAKPSAAISPVLEGSATPQRPLMVDDSRPQLTTSPPAAVERIATTPSSQKIDTPAIAIGGDGAAAQGFQTPVISQSSTPPPAISPWSSADGSATQGPPATGQRGSPWSMSSAPPATKPHVEDQTEEQPSTANDQPPVASAPDCSATARSPTVSETIEGPPATSLLEENSAAMSPTPSESQGRSSPGLRSHADEIQNSPRAPFYESAGSLLAPPAESLLEPPTSACNTAAEPIFATDVRSPATAIQLAQEDSPAANNGLAAHGISPEIGSPSDFLSDSAADSPLGPASVDSATASNDAVAQRPDSVARRESAQILPVSPVSKSPLQTSPQSVANGPQPQSPPTSAQHGAMRATTSSETPPTPGAEPTAATSPVVEGNATPQRTPMVGDSPQLTTSPSAVVERTAMTPSPHKTDMSATRPIAVGDNGRATHGFQTPLISQSSTPPPATSPWSSPPATGQRKSPYAMSPRSVRSGPPVSSVANDGEFAPAMKPHVGEQTEDLPAAANDRPPAAPAHDSSATARSPTIGDAIEGPSATITRSETPTQGSSQGSSSPELRSHADEIQRSPRAPFYESIGSLQALSTEADVGSPATEIQPAQEDSPATNNGLAAHGISPEIGSPSDFLSSSAADSPLGPASMDSATTANDAVAQRPDNVARRDAARNPPVSPVSKSPLQTSPQSVVNSPQPQSPPMSSQRRATTPSEASPASKVGDPVAATSPVLEGSATPQRTHTTGDSRPQLTISPPAVVERTATTPSPQKTGMLATGPIAIGGDGAVAQGVQIPLISRSSTPPPAISPWSSPPTGGQRGTPYAITPSSVRSAPPPAVPSVTNDGEHTPATKPHVEDQTEDQPAAANGQPPAASVRDSSATVPSEGQLATIPHSENNSAAKSLTPGASQRSSTPEQRSHADEMQSSPRPSLYESTVSLQAPSTEASNIAVEPAFATNIGSSAMEIQPAQEHSPVTHESAAQGISPISCAPSDFLSSSAADSPLGPASMDSATAANDAVAQRPDSATRGESARIPPVSPVSKSLLPTSPRSVVNSPNPQPQSPPMSAQRGATRATTPSEASPALKVGALADNATPQRRPATGDSPQLTMSPPAVVVRAAMTPSPHKTDMSAIAVEGDGAAAQGFQTPPMSQSSTPPPVISPWSTPPAPRQFESPYAISPWSVSSGPPPAVPSVTSDGERTPATKLHVEDQTEDQPEAANDRAPAPDSSATARSPTVGNASEGPPTTSLLEENSAAQSTASRANQDGSSPVLRSHADEIQSPFYEPTGSLQESPSGSLQESPAGSLQESPTEACNTVAESIFPTDVRGPATEIVTGSPTDPSPIDSAPGTPDSATCCESTRSPPTLRGIESSPQPQSPPTSAHNSATRATTPSETPPVAEPAAATSPVIESSATPQRTPTTGDSPQLTMSPPAVVVRAAMTPSPHKTDTSAIAVEGDGAAAQGFQTPPMSQSSTPPPVISPWSTPPAPRQFESPYAISPWSVSSASPHPAPVTPAKKSHIGNYGAAPGGQPEADSSATARSPTVGDASEGPPARSALSEENSAVKSPTPRASIGSSTPELRSHADEMQSSPRPSLYESTGSLRAPPAGVATELTFATDNGSLRNSPQPQSPPTSAQRGATRMTTPSETPPTSKAAEPATVTSPVLEGSATPQRTPTTGDSPQLAMSPPAVVEHTATTPSPHKTGMSTIAVEGDGAAAQGFQTPLMSQSSTPPPVISPWSTPPAPRQFESPYAISPWSVSSGPPVSSVANDGEFAPATKPHARDCGAAPENPSPPEADCSVATARSPTVGNANEGSPARSLHLENNSAARSPTVVERMTPSPHKTGMSAIEGDGAAAQGFQTPVISQSSTPPPVISPWSTPPAPRQFESPYAISPWSVSSGPSPAVPSVTSNGERTPATKLHVGDQTEDQPAGANDRAPVPDSSAAARSPTVGNASEGPPATIPHSENQSLRSPAAESFQSISPCSVVESCPPPQNPPMVVEDDSDAAKRLRTPAVSPGAESFQSISPWSTAENSVPPQNPPADRQSDSPCVISVSSGSSAPSPATPMANDGGLTATTMSPIGNGTGGNRSTAPRRSPAAVKIGPSRWYGGWKCRSSTSPVFLFRAPRKRSFAKTWSALFSRPGGNGAGAQNPPASAAPRNQPHESGRTFPTARNERWEPDGRHITPERRMRLRAMARAAARKQVPRAACQPGEISQRTTVDSGAPTTIPPAANPATNPPTGGADAAPRIEPILSDRETRQARDERRRVLGPGARHLTPQRRVFTRSVVADGFAARQQSTEGGGAPATSPSVAYPATNPASDELPRFRGPSSDNLIAQGRGLSQSVAGDGPTTQSSRAACQSATTSQQAGEGGGAPVASSSGVCSATTPASYELPRFWGPSVDDLITQGRGFLQSLAGDDPTTQSSRAACQSDSIDQLPAVGSAAPDPGPPAAANNSAPYTAPSPSAIAAPQKLPNESGRTARTARNERWEPGGRHITPERRMRLRAMARAAARKQVPRAACQPDEISQRSTVDSGAPATIPPAANPRTNQPTRGAGAAPRPARDERRRFWAPGARQLTPQRRVCARSVFADGSAAQSPRAACQSRAVSQQSTEGGCAPATSSSVAYPATNPASDELPRFWGPSFDDLIAQGRGLPLSVAGDGPTRQSSRAACHSGTTSQRADEGGGAPVDPPSAAYPATNPARGELPRFWGPNFDDLITQGRGFLQSLAGDDPTTQSSRAACQSGATSQRPSEGGGAPVAFPPASYPAQNPPQGDASAARQNQPQESGRTALAAGNERWERDGRHITPERRMRLRAMARAAARQQVPVAACQPDDGSQGSTVGPPAANPATSPPPGDAGAAPQRQPMECDRAPHLTGRALPYANLVRRTRTPPKANGTKSILSIFRRSIFGKGSPARRSPAGYRAWAISQEPGAGGDTTARVPPAAPNYCAPYPVAHPPPGAVSSAFQSRPLVSYAPHLARRGESAIRYMAKTARRIAAQCAPDQSSHAASQSGAMWQRTAGGYGAFAAVPPTACAAISPPSQDASAAPPSPPMEADRAPHLARRAAPRANLVRDRTRTPPRSNRSVFPLPSAGRGPVAEIPRAACQSDSINQPPTVGSAPPGPGPPAAANSSAPYPATSPPTSAAPQNQPIESDHTALPATTGLPRRWEPDGRHITPERRMRLRVMARAAARKQFPRAACQPDGINQRSTVDSGAPAAIPPAANLVANPPPGGARAASQRQPMESDRALQLPGSGWLYMNFSRRARTPPKPTGAKSNLSISRRSIFENSSPAQDSRAGGQSWAISQHPAPGGDAPTLVPPKAPSYCAPYPATNPPAGDVGAAPQNRPNNSGRTAIPARNERRRRREPDGRHITPERRMRLRAMARAAATKQVRRAGAPANQATNPPTGGPPPQIEPIASDRETRQARDERRRVLGPGARRLTPQRRVFTRPVVGDRSSNQVPPAAGEWRLPPSAPPIGHNLRPLGLPTRSDGAPTRSPPMRSDGDAADSPRMVSLRSADSMDIQRSSTVPQSSHVAGPTTIPQSVGDPRAKTVSAQSNAGAQSPRRSSRVTKPPVEAAPPVTSTRELPAEQLTTAESLFAGQNSNRPIWLAPLRLEFGCAFESAQWVGDATSFQFAAQNTQ